MPEPSPASPTSPPPPSEPVPAHAPAASTPPLERGPRGIRGFFALRKEASTGEVIVFSTLCIALVFGLWWFVTRGPSEERILPYSTLPSPRETFQSFPELWFQRALTRNTLASLRRVTLGFGLAALIGVPLGVLCGCFSWFNAFFVPLSIFGRNIPVAALIPLTYSLFGIGEFQKVMFIFIACVAFIVADTARSVRDVGSPYVDTAYTLGASRWQVIVKVLVPLALPSVFNSLRLLFGLAFGYIMLAELIKIGGASGGLGDIIETSQRRGRMEDVLLVLMIIPVVALGIDRLFFWVQKELFPSRYGGAGILHRMVRGIFHAWDDLKTRFFRPKGAVDLTVPAPAPKAEGS